MTDIMTVDEMFAQSALANIPAGKKLLLEEEHCHLITLESGVTRDEFIKSLSSQKLVIDIYSHINNVSQEDDNYKTLTLDDVNSFITSLIETTRAETTEIYLDYLFFKFESDMRKYTERTEEFFKTLVNKEVFKNVFAPVAIKSRYTFGIDFREDVTSFLNFLAALYNMHINMSAAHVTFALLRPDDERLTVPIYLPAETYEPLNFFSKIDIPYKLKYLDQSNLDAQCVRNMFIDHLFDELWFFNKTDKIKKGINAFFNRYGKNRKIKTLSDKPKFNSQK